MSLQYIHTNDHKEETMSNIAYHMDPIKIDANLINVQAKTDTNMSLEMPKLQVSPTITMTEKIHQIDLKITLPSLRETNP